METKPAHPSDSPGPSGAPLPSGQTFGGCRPQSAAHSTSTQAGFCFETRATSNQGGDSPGAGGGPVGTLGPGSVQIIRNFSRGTEALPTLHVIFMSSHEPQKAEVKQSSVSLVCRDGKGFSRTGPPLRDEERRKTSGCHIYLERAFVFALDGGSWSTAGNVLSRTLPRPAKGAAGLTPRDPNSSLRTLRVPHHTPHSVLGCTKRSFFCLL